MFFLIQKTTEKQNQEKEDKKNKLIEEKNKLDNIQSTDENKTNMKDILIYHGLGTGKTVTAINILNILYNKYNNINCILLIKKSLKNDPWINNLNIWLNDNKIGWYQKGSDLNYIQLVDKKNDFSKIKQTWKEVK